MTDWPSRTITVRTRNLPHWTAEEGTYFVTFRLADALTPAEAWQIRQRRRYALHASTLMPNHVHVALRTSGSFSLANVLHSWKSFTANEANRILKCRGAFWQDESYDCLLHDQNDLDRVISYIQENPRVAGLRDWRWTAVVRTEFSF